MERDEMGRVLSKSGKCPICGKRQTVLIDEDIDCCDRYEEEEIEEEEGPAQVLVTCGNDAKRNFTARDLILAMIGEAWIDIDKVRRNIENIGADFIAVVDSEEFDKILKEMEEEELISVYWDIRSVGRNF